MFAKKKGVLQQFALTQKESALNIATKAYFSRLIAGKNLVTRKEPHANLKLQYRRVLELSFVAALTLVVGLTQMGRAFSLTSKSIEKVDIIIEVADIPPTKQLHRPPPPPRPSVPVPSESENIPEDLTIASTELDLSDLPPPPAPPEDDGSIIFVAYDEPPKIKGGMKELAKHLKYPRLAQNAGVEGIVFVKVLVSADGKTERTEIIKVKPANMGFEKSAMDAIKKVQWEPAKQRDRNIRVWVSIPVQFKLINS